MCIYIYIYSKSVIVCLIFRLSCTHRYQGHISAALVLGGVDVTGPHLHCIYPHGSSDKLPYVTMGSGSLAAMSVFESRFKPNMDVSNEGCSSFID